MSYINHIWNAKHIHKPSFWIVNCKWTISFFIDLMASSGWIMCGSWAICSMACCWCREWKINEIPKNMWKVWNCDANAMMSFCSKWNRESFAVKCERIWFWRHLKEASRYTCNDSKNYLWKRRKTRKAQNGREQSADTETQNISFSLQMGNSYFETLATRFSSVSFETLLNKNKNESTKQK